jgi:nuclear pore complex protein Nup62
VTTSLKNKTLEDILNDWGAELEDQVRIFTKEAITISKWDKDIMENGDQLFKLHTEVQRVQVGQKELDQSLEIIHTQQSELHQLLDSLEADITSLYNESEMGPTDEERDKGYQLAENINGQLDQMSNTLKELISKLNAHSKDSDDQNPVSQIIKILNAHLNSLQWIDQNSAVLNTKIQEVSKQFGIQLKEQERLYGERSRFS